MAFYFVKKPRTHFPVVALRTTEKWVTSVPPEEELPTGNGFGAVNVTTHAGTSATVAHEPGDDAVNKRF